MIRFNPGLSLIFDFMPHPQCRRLVFPIRPPEYISIKIRSAVFLWPICPRFLILKQGSDLILDSFWTTGPWFVLSTACAHSIIPQCSLYEVQVHQLVPPYLLSVILEHFVRVLHCADYFHVSQLQFGLNKIPVISLQQRKIEQQGSVKQPKF